MGDNGARIPKLVAAAASKSVAAMPLSSIDGYVMSRIDGATTERDLVSSLGLAEETVDEALGKLEFLGLIEYVWAPPPPPRPRTPPPRPTRAAPQQAPQQRARSQSVVVPGLTAYDPKDLDEEVELERPQKKKVLDLFHRLHALNHYEALGVPGGSDKKIIKRAYFELATVLHPDRYFRKNLGSYKLKMEACFARISEAHDVLTSKKRAEYDDYLGIVAVTQVLEEKLAVAHDLELRIVAQSRDDEMQLVRVTEQMELKLLEQAKKPGAQAKKPAANASMPPKSIEDLLQEALTQLGDGNLGPEFDQSIDLFGPTGWDPEAETAVATRNPQSEPPMSPRTGSAAAGARRASSGAPGSAPASARRASSGAPGPARTTPAPPPPSVPAQGRRGMPPPPSSSADFGAVRPVTRAGPTPNATALQREALARRLLGGSGRAMPSRPRTFGVMPAPRISIGDNAPPPAAGIPAHQQMSSTDAMAALRRMYEDRVLGGRRKQASRHVDAAREAMAKNDPVAALNAFRLATTLDPGDKGVQEELDRAQGQADGILAESYQKQATYEEKNENWKEAARSWAKVAKTRPSDARAHDRAAFCLMKANGDMHEAAQLGSRAVALSGSEPEYRLTLAQVYLAAGLPKNAKRELEVADKIKPKDASIQALLKRATKAAV